MANIIDLGNVSNRSVVVTVHKPLRQLKLGTLSKFYSDRTINPIALAEVYADVNYRGLRFEKLEDR